MALRAAVVNGASSRRGEGPDEVDLPICLLLPGQSREGLWTPRDHLVTCCSFRAAFRQQRFRQDRLHDEIAAGGLRPENFVIRGNCETPGVSALRGELLKSRPIRPEPDDA